jgi:hypothetical protein
MLQEKMRIEKLKVKEGASDAEQRLFPMPNNAFFSKTLIFASNLIYWM